jgi:hypothetical protein
VTLPLGTRDPALAASTIPPLSVRLCGTRSATHKNYKRDQTVAGPPKSVTRSFEGSGSQTNPQTPWYNGRAGRCLSFIGSYVFARAFVWGDVDRHSWGNSQSPPPFSCYDTGLIHPDPPLLPLRFRSTRVHAAQARVCWRVQSTVDSLFFIDVPTNPGPLSFCDRPVRCRCARPTP